MPIVNLIEPVLDNGLMQNKLSRTERKSSRSQAYQWALVEVPYSPDSPIFAQVFKMAEPPSMLKEILLDLELELQELLVSVLKNNLTPRQVQVLSMASDGMTQCEIASSLGLNQSTICKALYGQQQYDRRRKYGGINHKLNKIIMKNAPLFIPLMTELDTYMHESFDIEIPTFRKLKDIIRAEHLEPKCSCGKYLTAIRLRHGKTDCAACSKVI